MKFGLYAPNPNVTIGSPEVARAAGEALQPLSVGKRDGQFDHATSLLLAADAYGFDLTLFAERHLGNDIGAWIMAASIASRFEHMRALVAVHPGLWHPVMIAKLAASLDRICKGRMAINIVNGTRDDELVMFGGTPLKGEARYELASEFIAILRGLWTEETYSLSGEYYALNQAQLLLKPGSSTPPDIFSVSTSDRGRDFIAQSCDWWFVDFPRDAETTDDLLRSVEASIADMRRRSDKVGKRIHFALNPFLALGSSEEQALEEAICRISAEVQDVGLAKYRTAKSGLVAATKGGCIGRPEAVRRQVQRFHDMGVELVLLKMLASLDNIERIADQVIAPMRRAEPSHQAIQH